MTIDQYNYFDIAEAIYCFASLYHEGQGSYLYSVLSQSEFRPGPMWSEEFCERENFYYGEILSMDTSEFSEIVDQLNSYMKGLKK